MKHNRGFTVAGLLMTLMIMGFIFILAIPIVKVNNKAKEKMINTNVKQVNKKVLIMKAFTDINQALLNIKYQKNCDTLECTKLFEQGQSKNFADALALELKPIKNCYNLINKGCFSDKVTDPSKSERINFDSLPNAYRFITKRGFSVLVLNKENKCNDEINGYKYCGEIIVDVNGTQVPNTYGKDIFTYYIIDSIISGLPTKAQSQIQESQPTEDQIQIQSKSQLQQPIQQQSQDISQSQQLNQAELDKIIEMALKELGY